MKHSNSELRHNSETSSSPGSSCTSETSTSREASRKRGCCAICGLSMRANASSIQRHCQNQHSGSNDGFLKEGQLPQDSMYQNFEEFLIDTSISLITKPNRRFKRPTRKPQKNNAAGAAGVDSGPHGQNMQENSAALESNQMTASINQFDD